jgi:hypothetical protein
MPLLNRRCAVCNELHFRADAQPLDAGLKRGTLAIEQVFEK